MKKGNDKMIREYLASIGRKGGKARAAKYDKKTLSKWAKKGGRPPKEKGEKQ
jgi:general stress protein YciG